VKRVLTAAVLIPLVLLAVFRAPLWLFALLLLVTAVLATLEYLQIAERTGLVPFRRLTLIMNCGFLVLAGGRLVTHDLVSQIRSRSVMGPEVTENERFYFDLANSITTMGSVLILLVPFLLLVRGMKREPLGSSLPGAAVSWFTLAYISFPLYTLLSLRSGLFGSFLILYLFLVVWVGDIFAYYVGSTIGERKLAPRISPGKSWEGAAASLVAAALLGGWMLAHAGSIYQFLESIHLVLPRKDFFGQDVRGVFPGLVPWWHAMLLSVGINIAAQLGDLVESMLKRGAGVKDSGHLLPGHGGMLDRIDALLFAAPVLWYYATFRLIPF
jgi:phosphatidate cytidylyltransferase